MKKLNLIVQAAALVALTAAAAAVPPGTRPDGTIIRPAVRGVSRMHYGGPAVPAKAAADTLYLLGGPARSDGKFQDSSNTLPDAEGWISVDMTASAITHWHVSDFNAALLDPGQVPNHAMWCGDLFASCAGWDPPEGYGNDWNEFLDWYGTVADNTLPTTVRVTARLNHDVEIDYDYLFLAVERFGGWDNVLTFTSANLDTNFNVVPVDVDASFTVGTADYVGETYDQVHLRWQMTSDSGYSDQDCGWPGAGAAQLDNLTVLFNGVQQTLDDFEPGNPVNWLPVQPPAVGDFAKVWPRLADLDPCGADNSPQFAFIDDGVVCPGTGGSQGISWTYGPGGFTVNLTGGLAGPDYHLRNEIWSPVLDWPVGYDGGLLTVTVYEHLPLENGLFDYYQVRSSNDGGVTWDDWQSNGWVNFSNVPRYFRTGQPQYDDFSTMMLPGRDKVQIALGAWEYGWIWGFNGTDATPGPYYDNVQIVAYRATGPAMASRDIDLFNDNFPAIGVIDYANLGANSVRVDMALNISNQLHQRNDPGDSMIVDISVVRPGAVMSGRPEMHVLMKANPLFDPYRTLPPGFTRTGALVRGIVYGDTTYTRPQNTVVADRWNWDLPDEGFFYPGDAFHYFILARDDLAGDIGVALLPADTSGYSFFPDMAGYDLVRFDTDFVINALPTMRGTTVNDQPKILFWNDFGNRGGENEWMGALAQLGYHEGADYDVYYTTGPSSAVGNGLGGRASPLQLAGYRTMLYTSGDLSTTTLSNGDFQLDAGNDVAVVDAWLQQGGKNFFATGDDLEADLNVSGAATVAFRNTWLSVSHVSGNAKPLIGNQSAPRVLPIAGNALGLTEPFVAYGGCFQINDFDAVTPVGTAVRAAEFANPAGTGGTYPYAALVYNNVAANTARVVYMPFDFMFVFDPVAKAPADTPARAKLLQKILLHFGESPSGVATDVPEAGVFASRSYPNPFNPSATIEYSLPRAGELTIRIFNVRGELVRTLFDGRVDQPTGRVVWDGADGAGRAAASGVYFCQVKTPGHEAFNKMTLVK